MKLDYKAVSGDTLAKVVVSLLVLGAVLTLVFLTR